LAVAFDRLLKRGDGGVAHERHVDTVGGAQAIVEIGAQLFALFPLLGRDRTAIGEGVERIERIESARSLRHQRELSSQGCE